MHRLPRSATALSLVLSLAVVSTPALAQRNTATQPEDDELVLDDEDDELVLDDEDDVVDDPPARATTSPAEAEANERLARQLYAQAEEFFNTSRFAKAITKYEAGYRLVPDKHGFAYKIGIAAWELRDCVKAQAMLEAFVDRAQGQPKFRDRINIARSRLASIRDSGCAEQQAAGAVIEDDDELVEDEGYEEESPRERRRARRRAARMADDDENPLGLSSRDLRKSASRRADLRDRVEGGGLLATGITLMTLGVMGAGTGVAFNILGHNYANELLELSKRDPVHKYPTGDWACRDSSAACPYDIERQMNTYGTVTPIAYASGGAMFAVGLTLVVVRAVARKKLRNSESDPNKPSSSGALGLAERLPNRPKPRLETVSPMLQLGGGRSSFGPSIGATARVRF